MANLRALLFLAVAALVLAPAVQAATPIAPVATITGFSLAPTSGIVPLGGSTNFTISFGSLKVTNTICPQATDGVVALSFSGNGPAGVTGSLPPAGIPVTFAASTGADATATLKAGTAALQFVVSAAPSAGANHDHTFYVNATYTGPTANCNNTAASGQDPQATVTVSVPIAIKTGPAKGNTTTTPPIGCTAGSTAASCSVGPTTDTQASPLADVPTVAMLLLGVALLASRRQK